MVKKLLHLLQWNRQEINQETSSEGVEVVFSVVKTKSCECSDISDLVVFGVVHEQRQPHVVLPSVVENTEQGLVESMSSYEWHDRCKIFCHESPFVLQDSEEEVLRQSLLFRIS